MSVNISKILHLKNNESSHCVCAESVGNLGIILVEGWPFVIDPWSFEKLQVNRSKMCLKISIHKLSYYFISF